MIFFRVRLDQMIDLRHPLAGLAQIDAARAPALARKNCKGLAIEGSDLFGSTLAIVGASASG